MSVAATTSNVTEYSVSELSQALKRTVEEAYGFVRVRGELGELKIAASGHAYFRLKDERAVLDCVCWRIAQKRLAFKLDEGLELICTGRITTYPGRSTYQLVVEQMEPAGEGALLALLEERKRRLAAEGLFAVERKRMLPYLPRVIGVVTSPTGAVIRDILHRLAERCPCRVVLWPVLVQGEGAAAQIAAAVDGFSALPEDGPVPRPDVLIVARGGGSIEDLWAFNEEIVVRAAASCSIPLISAVGHETDTTLIDFAADCRAPTPTAAAEIAVPVRRELLTTLATLGQRQARAIDRELRGLRERVEGLRRGLTDPRRLLATKSQRLDDLAERLRLRSPLEIVRSQRERLATRLSRLDELVRDRLRQRTRELRLTGARLTPGPVLRQRELGQRALQRETQALQRAVSVLLQTTGKRLGHQAALLGSLGHERVLERGYAIVRRRSDGHVVARLGMARDETAFDIQLTDGTLGVVRPGGPSRGRRSAETAESQQGSLL